MVRLLASPDAEDAKHMLSKLSGRLTTYPLVLLCDALAFKSPSPDGAPSVVAVAF